MRIDRREAAQDLAVMLALVLVIILIIWVYKTSPCLVTGTLSATNSRILTIGVTIAGQTFTSFVGSQIQKGLMRSLEDRLQAVQDEPHLIINPRSSIGEYDREMIRKLDKNWRSILKIDTVLEKVRNYPIFLLYLFSSLVTTSIVTTFTATIATRQVSYHDIIPDTSFGFYSDGTNRSCFGIYQPPFNDGIPIRAALGWSVENGSLFYSAFDAECPPAFMMEAAAGINYKSPGDYVYAQSGVAVERTAIGAPMSIFTGAAFGNLSSQYGQSLVKLTHCVPVLTSNPARCQKSGRVIAVSANHLVTQVGNITLSHGVLPENLPSADYGLSRVLGRDSAMSNDIFPLDTGSVGSVGVTFMVFGARNDEQGDVSFASYLAGTVNDPDDSAGRGGNATYAVTCAVDASSSFEYRRVTLDLRALGKDKESNYAQYLSGGEPCEPPVPTIGSKLLATAGSASITLVHENLAKDGYFATLHRLSGYRRGPPYAFPESTNALEDVLGLISGLAVSRLPLTAEVNEGKYGDSSSAVIEMTRLGTGSSEALWLLIPPAGSLIALFILFVMGIRRQWVRGGRCFSGSERERPHLYTAESAYYLIRLGTTAVRNVEQKSAIQ